MTDNKSRAFAVRPGEGRSIDLGAVVTGDTCRSGAALFASATWHAWYGASTPGDSGSGVELLGDYCDATCASCGARGSNEELPQHGNEDFVSDAMALTFEHTEPAVWDGARDRAPHLLGPRGAGPARKDEGGG